MNTIPQQIASANLLAYVRGREAALYAVTGLDRTLEQALYRSEHAPIGTENRRHKIVDRRQRKLDNRYRAHAATYAQFKRAQAR